MAAPPATASGEFPSIETETVRPDTVDATVGRVEADGFEGDTGLLLPPQADISIQAAPSEAAWQAWLQNSRRVEGIVLTPTVFVGVL